MRPFQLNIIEYVHQTPLMDVRTTQVPEKDAFLVLGGVKYRVMYTEWVLDDATAARLPVDVFVVPL